MRPPWCYECHSGAVSTSLVRNPTGRRIQFKGLQGVIQGKRVGIKKYTQTIHLNTEQTIEILQKLRCQIELKIYIYISSGHLRASNQYLVQQMHIICKKYEKYKCMQQSIHPLTDHIFYQEVLWYKIKLSSVSLALPAAHIFNEK